MDGSKLSRSEVEGLVGLIKAKMPETYRAIQEKAAVKNREAYAMVRRGLAGTPNAFWAMERGHVVGTPFKAGHAITAVVAETMVMFGSRFVVMWGNFEGERAEDGA